MRFSSILSALAAIRAFEDEFGLAEAAAGSAYAYRFFTDCGGLFQVEIYGAESGALLGIL